MEINSNNKKKDQTDALEVTAAAAAVYSNLLPADRTMTSQIKAPSWGRETHYLETGLFLELKAQPSNQENTWSLPVERLKDSSVPSTLKHPKQALVFVSERPRSMRGAFLFRKN